MIRVNNLNLDFAGNIIFKNISLQIKKTDRIGLIGNNGSGVSPPNAAANTGDGGHGPVANPSPGGTGGNGGSGIVMIRYKFQ